MKISDVIKSPNKFSEWYNEFDASIMFINWYYIKLGVSIPSFGSAKELYDNVLNSGTEISKSNLKSGDIVFFKTSESESKVGLFVRQSKSSGKFICLEAKELNGKIKILESYRKYSDCSFIRPLDSEEVVEPKTKKKK